jgi:adenylate cyclase
MQDNNMPISQEKFKLKLKTVLLMTVIWLSAGVFFHMVDFLSGNAYRNGNSPVDLDRTAILVLRIISVAIAGIITGIFEAFISEKRYARLHFGKLILYSSFYYLALYFALFVLGIFLYRVIVFTDDISFVSFNRQMLNYLLTPQSCMSLMIFGTLVLFSTFILRTREKFGPRTISRLLAGKYFFPKEERRIFMFLDLKSSTSIAEKLGPLKYHQFLNDFFRVITYPVLYRKGEIYQYVGDEITVSWSEKNGIKNDNCLECFFEIEKAVRHSMQDFIIKYDVIPEFKASMHAGKTVAGEIGIIKREIVYSGDTLNTAARIQELCNKYGEKLLISGDLMEMLNPQKDYLVNEIGEKYLRGRTASIMLYGIRKQAAEIAA